MRKVYKKPCLILDSFKLSESVAGDCEMTNIVNMTRGVCALIDPETGFQIFVQEVVNCQDILPGQYDSLCYDVPIESMNLFSS